MVSICGEMGSDPLAVMLLLGMGVRKLSMSSAKLPRIKWLIRSLEIADTEKFLRAALELDNAQSIRELGRETMRTIGIDYEQLQVA
ncbi:MAG TPA: putative PEP-binding protein [Anaerolineales bacterium]|nr:putative PEP-binding protein [Anaerolineales bacterium]